VTLSESIKKFLRNRINLYGLRTNEEDITFHCFGSRIRGNIVLALSHIYHPTFAYYVSYHLTNMSHTIMFMLTIVGATALSLQKGAESLAADRCSCSWVSSDACAPGKDDGSDCMTVCCSSFFAAFNAPSAPVAEAPPILQQQAPPIQNLVEEKEEKLTCDCSWALTGGCNGSQEGDGSPCGIKCCAPADQQIKGVLSDFTDNIKGGFDGFKDKLSKAAGGFSIGGGDGPTPKPGSAIKVEIPVWR
jgi:hypothetical protein